MLDLYYLGIGLGRAKVHVADTQLTLRISDRSRTQSSTHHATRPEPSSRSVHRGAPRKQLPNSLQVALCETETDLSLI